MSVSRLPAILALLFSLLEHAFSFNEPFLENGHSFIPSTSLSHFLDLVPTANEETWKAIKTGQVPMHLTKSHKKSKAILYGIENSFVNITCEVSADPEAEFQWKFRGKDLVLYSSQVACEDEENQHCRTAVTAGENKSILKVKVQESTLGEYTCRASNELGASERNFFVRMGTKPPVPEFLAEIVPNAGILVKLKSLTKRDRTYINRHMGQEVRKENGEILPVLGFTIQMRRFRSCDVWRNITTKMHNNQKLIQHQLRPGTVYRMRLAAWTEVGRGEFSGAKTVRYEYEYERGSTDVPDDDWKLVEDRDWD